MAHRHLSDDERAVLAHIELSPEAWWANQCLKFTQAQAETQLANKLSRWRADYEAASVQPGYRTRAQRVAD